MTKVGGIDVSRETIEKLELFVRMVQKWNRSINLVARSTLNDVWDRHVVDSAQIYSKAPEDFGTWLDLGSGGGFPGIVISILAQELQPTARVTLVESDLRKAAFLRTAVRHCELMANVFTDRIESLPPLGTDVVSARALGNLSQLLAFMELHGNDNCVGIFPKGRSFEAEIAEARKNWRFDVVARNSLTDNEAKVLVIKEIQRVVESS